MGTYWVQSIPFLKGFLVVKQLGYHPNDTADGRNTAPGEVGSLSHYSIYTILGLYILGGAGFLPATGLLIDD